MKHNPAAYRALSEPFASKSAANAALEAFSADVAAAREKHCMADVLVVVRVSAKHEDGGEGGYMSLDRIGDSLQHEPMAAFALGTLSEERRAAIAALASGRGKR